MTPDYRFLAQPARPELAPAMSTSQTLDSRAWYVKTEGTVYGPFDDRTVWTYVQEGRVTAHSLLSLRPDGGYLPARDWLEIAHWFTLPATHAENSSSAMTPKVEPALPLRLSMVVADIKSGRLSLFIHALETVGEVQSLSTSTWLVETSLDPESIRAVLGPTLSVKDKLLVLDATHAETASYNYGADTETA
ncbi:MAG: hypothetical protein WBG08_04780 [Litorimonas sp.]